MKDFFRTVILRAEKTDHTVLTQIAFAAKKHWQYPKAYFDIWREELTITENYIVNNMVYKSLIKDIIVAFYSVVENINDSYSGEIFVQKGHWLEHIFVLPEYHHKGIGRLMINHLKNQCKLNHIRNLLIFTDPYAKGFYEKIGAVFLYDSPSSIPGRMIPVYQLGIGF